VELPKTLQNEKSVAGAGSQNVIILHLGLWTLEFISWHSSNYTPLYTHTHTQPLGCQAAGVCPGYRGTKQCQFSAVQFLPQPEASRSEPCVC